MEEIARSLPALGPEQIVQLVAGIVLLVAGRRIFWLLVGAVGFFFAFQITQEVLRFANPELRLLVAIGAGILGVVLAIFLQKVAVAVAGFGVGSGLAMLFLGTSPSALTPGEALLAVVVGGAAAFVSVVLFEAALVVQSSLFGASLVVRALALGEPAGVITLAVLFVVGVLIQQQVGPRHKRRRRRRRDEDDDD